MAMRWRSAGQSIPLASPLFGGELSKRVQVASSRPLRLTVPGELVRIDFDLFGIVPGQHDLTHLLVLEIEPFVIGVGEARVENTREGVVIRGADSRIVDDVKHDVHLAKPETGQPRLYKADMPAAPDRLDHARSTSRAVAIPWRYLI